MTLQDSDHELEHLSDREHTAEATGTHGWRLDLNLNQKSSTETSAAASHGDPGAARWLRSIGVTKNFPLLSKLLIIVKPYHERCESPQTLFRRAYLILWAKISSYAFAERYLRVPGIVRVAISQRELEHSQFMSMTSFAYYPVSSTLGTVILDSSL